MATSATWEFVTPQTVEIITEAYERVGILPDILTAQKIQTATRSLNFILQSWINKGLNQWSVKQGMIGLIPNQTSYELPNQGVAIMEATVRTSTRNLGGTATSSAGGTAANAFDGNIATACTQTAPDGNISYTWGSSLYPISMVGIQSAATLTYTLVGEYSFDGATWSTAVSIPAQSYEQLDIAWFTVPVPVPANYFRVRESGGATLNITELYFNTNLNDTIITGSSRAEYIAYPNKATPGKPSSFYLDRQIVPVIYLYPTPNALYNNLFYTYTQSFQDIGSMTENAQVPARFLEALASALTWRLAVKENQMDKVPVLKGLADEEYDTAGKEDRERVPLRIYGNYMRWS